MRRSFLPLLLVAGVAVAAPAAARGIHVEHSQCDYDTSYDVFVTDAGVRFMRDTGAPSKVFMHDGRLRVDGRDVAVGAADAESLRRYEAEVRAVVPEVAGIAREGLDIGFSAMTTVAATFAQDADERGRVMERLNRRHAAALRGVDDTLGRGEWRQGALGDTIGKVIKDTVGELVGPITAGAVKAALSGDDAQVAALEARTDALEATIERDVDARADKLSDRADLLCRKFDAMNAMQQQWQFRLDDGQPLELLRKRPHEQHEQGEVAAR